MSINVVPGEGVPDQMRLTAEEVEVVLQFRKEKEVLKEKRITFINDALGAAIQNRSSCWEGWPGTVSIARAVYESLVFADIIKE